MQDKFFEPLSVNRFALKGISKTKMDLIRKKCMQAFERMINRVVAY